MGEYTYFEVVDKLVLDMQTLGFPLGLTKNLIDAIEKIQFDLNFNHKVKDERGNIKIHINQKNKTFKLEINYNFV